MGDTSIFLTHPFIYLAHPVLKVKKAKCKKQEEK